MNPANIGNPASEKTEAAKTIDKNGEALLTPAKSSIFSYPVFLFYFSKYCINNTYRNIVEALQTGMPLFYAVIIIFVFYYLKNTPYFTVLSSPGNPLQ